MRHLDGIGRELARREDLEARALGAAMQAVGRGIDGELVALLSRVKRPPAMRPA